MPGRQVALRIAVIGIKGIPARYGGFETCADETCRRMVQHGHRVTVYCRHGISDEEPAAYAGVRLIYVPHVQSKNLATITSSFLACVQAIRSDADVVHLYTVGTALFVPLLRVFGKRTVVSVDALDWKRKKWSAFASRYMQQAAKIAVRWADELIIDSKAVQDYYETEYGRRGVYVPFGANILPPLGSEDLSALGLAPRRYVLFVGMLKPEKQVDHLIQAFNELHQQQFDLVILGDDPLGREYVQTLKAMGGSRVRFLGRIYGELYNQVCQNAYLYVTPSEIEGTSPALLAAMGAGCCVLVNGIPENLETIGDAGFSYQVNDVQDLRRKLAVLLSQPEVVETYGQRAREHVKQKYSWDAVTRDFEDIYRRIVRRAN